MSQATRAANTIGATAQAIIADLMDAGYKVEDVGAEYGTAFAGQYRWIKLDAAGELLDFQDYEMSDSVSHAWFAAWAHYEGDSLN